MINRVDRRSSGCGYTAWAPVLGLLLLAMVGCSRAFYRRQADREVYAVVGCASDDPRWPLKEFTIRPDPESRMFDPNDPDCPPMPPDDPTSQRLIRCVDGKRGWPHWDRYGKTPFVENPLWRVYLPYEDDGSVVLDREGAVQMALLHSRKYQQELEDLYLSALDVTFERFQFDTQFFGGNSTSFEAQGPLAGGQSLLSTDTDLELQKLLATGSTLVVGMANSLVWQFAGPDQYGANTLLNFTLVQPLLRAAGRAVVLESLTDSERALLANIRQLERFRRGFYAQIVVGSTPVAGPDRRGIGFEAVSTDASRSAGGFLGLLSQEVQIRNQLAYVDGLRRSVDRLQAFYEGGLVSSQQVGLTRQSLYDAQSGLLSISAAYERDLDVYKILLGLPPELDVRIEDRLLARFDLIDPALTATQEAAADSLDRLRDQAEATEIDQQEEHLDELMSVRQKVADQLNLVRGDMQLLIDSLPARRESLRRMATREESKRGEIDPRIYSIDGLHRRVIELSKELEGIERAKEVAEQLAVKLERWEQFKRIERAKEQAEQWNVKLQGNQLKWWAAEQWNVKLEETELRPWEELWDLKLEETELKRWAEQWNVKLEETELKMSWEKLIERWEELKSWVELTGVAERLRGTLAELEQFQRDPSNAARAELDEEGRPKTPEELLRRLVERLSSELAELSLIQGKARLDMVTLTPIEIESGEALEVARRNRRDWMNARAALVDSWRQIEVTGKDLESELDVTFSGELGTTDNNPVRFRGSTGQLRVGLEFDAPLTRLEERNAYRETLIAYQQARRNYYAVEDAIGESLRNTIRTIRLNQLNFEVQRASVFVAIARVDEAQERVLEPGVELGPATARNLVEALSALLRAQNSLLRVWVDQEVLRMKLDLDLGTMQLDARGMWIDPGPTVTADTQKGDSAEETAEETPVHIGDAEEIPAPVAGPVGPDGA